MLFEKLALEQSMWKLLTTFKVGNSLRQRWNRNFLYGICLFSNVSEGGVQGRPSQVTSKMEYGRAPLYAPINVNPVRGGVRARGGDLMPETIPMSGF